MLKAKLAVVGGDAKTTEVNLRLPCVIGRGREVTLTLPHPLVSRRHCEIFERDGRLYVKDLGSLNGTFINNTKIVGEQVLNPNQLLTLGNVTFRAQYELGQPTDEKVVLNRTATIEDTVEAGLEPKVRSTVPTQPAHSPADPIQFEEVDQGEEVRQPAAGAVTDSRPAPAEPNGSTDQKAISDRETVYDDDQDQSASDTDVSVVESSLEAGSSGVSSDVMAEIDDLGDAPKSISVSAIEGLPVVPGSISFSGGIELEDGQKPKSAVEAVDLDLGDDAQPGPNDSAGMDSFVKKLPR